MSFSRLSVLEELRVQVAYADLPCLERLPQLSHAFFVGVCRDLGHIGFQLCLGVGLADRRAPAPRLASVPPPAGGAPWRPPFPHRDAAADVFYGLDELPDRRDQPLADSDLDAFISARYRWRASFDLSISGPSFCCLMRKLSFAIPEMGVHVLPRWRTSPSG